MRRTFLAAVLAAGLLVPMTLLAQGEGFDPQGVPPVGSVAPAFSLHAFSGSKHDDEDRNPVQLDDYCGVRNKDVKAVVLFFFDQKTAEGDLSVAAGWLRKSEKNGLRVIAISLEPSPIDLGAAVSKAGYRFPVLDDRHGIVGKRYGLSSAPFTLLLDSECRVLGLNNRSLQADAARINNAIGPILDGSMGSVE